jgi:predicted ATPase/DNA-binding SARP family transcriptional activator
MRRLAFVRPLGEGGRVGGSWVQFRLLGPFEVLHGGRPVGPAGTKRRGLLAMLVLRANYAVSAAELIDGLWADNPPPSATNLVQGYVSAWRKALEPGRPGRGGGDRLVTAGPAYRLRIEPGELDLDQFTEAVSSAQSAAAVGSHRDAAERLGGALKLWAGPPLADLAGLPFHRAAADRLEELRLQALEAWSAAALHTGRAQDVLAALQDARKRDPLRERLSELAMWALFQDGRQAEALVTYEQTRRLLADELGADPGAGLRRMHTRVLRQDPTLRAVSEPPPRTASPSELKGEPVEPQPGRQGTDPGLWPTPSEPRTKGSVATSPNNLPMALTSFVGREGEIEEITGLFASTRLLTLTGPGGCGKTRLAIRVAETLLGRYRDGIWLVELGTRPDRSALTGVLQAVTLALGVRETAETALIDGLVHHLRDRDLVLVLDNCEHLAQACADLSQRVLSACAGIRIVATSRARLGVPGEVEWPVPALQVPDEERTPPLARLPDYPSIRLFIDRAKAVLPRFALTESNGAGVAAICARLAGIPLAIELAAARVRMLSIKQIAGRLDMQLGLLSDSARYGPTRQRTLRGTMDWSYDLLAPREQVLFARLSVFVGSFSLEAAEEIAGDNGSGLDVFAGLVAQSLVVVDWYEESARYRLLEPVRQYAAERLAQQGETSNVRARHAAYYVRLAEQAESKLQGGTEQAGWFRRLELERHNLRGALQDLTETGDMVGVARLVSSLWRFFLVQGVLTDGRRLLGQALNHPSVAGEIRARALRTAGIFAHEQRDYEQAAAWYTEGLELFQAADNKVDAASILANLGLLAVDQSRFDEAVPLMEENLQLRQEIGDDSGTALALDNLGMLALHQGDLPAARELLEKSLVMFRTAEDMAGESVALNNLSRIAMRQGDADGATVLYGRGLLLNRELADQWSTGYCLEGLAEIAAGREQMTDAASLLGAAATLRERAGDALSVTDEAEHQRLLARVRTTLGKAEFEQAWSRGTTYAVTDAIGYGLQYLSS